MGNLSERCEVEGNAPAAAGAVVEWAMTPATDATGVRRVIDALDVLSNRLSLAGDTAGAWTTTVRAMEWLDLAA